VVILNILLGVTFPNVDWAKDEAHWMAGAANDTYCWLKHGVYEQCDDALFTNIGLEVEKNKVIIIIKY
jgi:hypothetical protein